MLLKSIFNARTCLSPHIAQCLMQEYTEVQTNVTSTGVKIICSDKVLGAQNIHIRQLCNFIIVK